MRKEYTDKWSEVIKNSDQINNAPLKKYRLNTLKENITENGLVRRYTSGKKDPRKSNKTILMVGETGSGKSTLINMMVNYMLGVKWEDDVRFEIIPEEGERPQTKSQTVAVTAYEIFGLEKFSVPFSLTVIDTPGFGEITGIDHDKHIFRNLNKLFESISSDQTIDAACLVVKASENRFSDRQKYIFDSALSLFGKDMEKNIMTLFTHSDWTPPPALDAIIALDVPYAKDENNKPVHFLFNNLPLQTLKKYERTFKTCWENGAESMHEFFQTLEKMTSICVQETKTVLEKRLKLEDSIKILLDHEQKKGTKKHLQIHNKDMRSKKRLNTQSEETAIKQRATDIEVRKKKSLPLPSKRESSIPSQTKENQRYDLEKEKAKKPNQTNEHVTDNPDKQQITLREEDSKKHGKTEVATTSSEDNIENVQIQKKFVLQHDLEKKQTKKPNQTNEHVTDNPDKQEDLEKEEAKEPKQTNEHVPDNPDKQEDLEKEEAKEPNQTNEHVTDNPDKQQDLENTEDEKTRLLEEAYQSILKLKECALKFRTICSHQHILALVDISRKTEDTEKVQKLEEMLKEYEDL